MRELTSPRGFINLIETIHHEPAEVHMITRAKANQGKEEEDKEKKKWLQKKRVEKIDEEGVNGDTSIEEEGGSHNLLQELGKEMKDAPRQAKGLAKRNQEKKKQQRRSHRGGRQAKGSNSKEVGSSKEGVPRYKLLEDLIHLKANSMSRCLNA